MSAAAATAMNTIKQDFPDITQSELGCMNKVLKQVTKLSYPDDTRGRSRSARSRSASRA